MLELLVNGFALITLLFSSHFAMAADGTPTLNQVYQAAESGRLGEAQAMMDKVLQSHPNSAKAHFVEAEILAKQGRNGIAASELSTAEQLAPGLPFAKSESVRQLKARLGAPRTGVFPEQGISRQGTPFPWGMLMLASGAIIVTYLIMRAFAARNSGTAVQPAAYSNVGAPVAPMGYGNMAGPASSGIGSGILGGLATGAAVGAGMVAGEALAHHFINGNSSPLPSSPPVDSWTSAGDDMGGADFGVADNGSWDDSSSIADSGSLGGDDWS